MSDLVDVANKSIPNPPAKKNAELIEAVYWIAGRILPVESKYEAFTKAKIKFLPPQDIERAKETLFNNLVNGELKSSGVYQEEEKHFKLYLDDDFQDHHLILNDDPVYCCDEEERKKLLPIGSDLWDSRKIYWEQGALMLADVTKETDENTFESYKCGYAEIKIKTDELFLLHKRLNDYTATSAPKVLKPSKRGKSVGGGAVNDSIRHLNILPKPTVPKKELEKFLRAEKKTLKRALPSRDDHWKYTKVVFPNHRLPRGLFTQVRETVWGKISPGPRKEAET